MASNWEGLGRICADGKKSPGLIGKIEIVEECGTTIPDANDYVHADYVEETVTTHPHTIATEITLATDYAWKELYFRDGQEANYTCVEEGEEDGEEQVVTITFFRPKLDPFVTWLMGEFGGGKAIVKFWDKGASDAFPRIAGEQHNGCKVTVQEQARPKNGYVVTITCRMRRKPYWYGYTA